MGQAEGRYCTSVGDAAGEYVSLVGEYMSEYRARREVGGME